VFHHSNWLIAPIENGEIQRELFAHNARFKLRSVSITFSFQKIFKVFIPLQKVAPEASENRFVIKAYQQQ
jgi:hypothetical protein